jgi:hypothetical protein
MLNMNEEKLKRIIKFNLFVILFEWLFFIYLALFVFEVMITPIRANILIMDKHGIETFNSISAIAKNVSESHEYQEVSYDCTQFSEELVRQLKAQLNLSAYCVVGKVELFNGTWGGHDWVEININGDIIPIEATSGEIILLDYNKRYKPLYRGLCL